MYSGLYFLEKDYDLLYNFVSNIKLVLNQASSSFASKRKQKYARNYFLSLAVCEGAVLDYI